MRVGRDYYYVCEIHLNEMIQVIREQVVGYAALTVEVLTNEDEWVQDREDTVPEEG